MIDSGTAERARLAAADEGREPWRLWGPYVSERAWGTVREDYSPSGDAWSSFPHDHARSRAYRWSEDGLAGVCDERQRWCFALALWNGVDPILKERIFGLTGPEGNHGEDPKECWWYLDATPTHSWMRWRYHYPQAPFPYGDLVAENGRRGRQDPEYELVDTGIFDSGRYWAVTVEYAKASPTDLCIRITAENRGPDEATLDLLPTLWFRNTWSWDRDPRRPQLRASGSTFVAEADGVGSLVLAADGAPEPLVCDNETNFARLWGQPNPSSFPKDGINDHVVAGAATVNPDGKGTKGAFRYRATVPGGGAVSCRLRLTAGDTAGDLGAGFDEVVRTRSAEADDYYAALTPPGTDDDEARVLRQAFAGLLWTKQYYGYDVRHWLDGDPSGPPPPEERRHGRNSRWRHVAHHDVISMPDKWEYPWFAAWDLAFHCVALAHVDPTFAKSQLLLMCDERYMHPNGQMSAYEWDFGDVNPPVHAWAAMEVFEIDGGRDVDFLERVFHKLIANFTWWLNRKDPEGDNLFEGGFLGLDNIGLFDRSSPLPGGIHLEQSDGTGWMVHYSLEMFRMALRLAMEEPAYDGMAVKFARHAIAIGLTANNQGLWDDEDGFFYDRLRADDGRLAVLRVRSMVGLIPLCAAVTVDDASLEHVRNLARSWAEEHAPELVERIGAERRRQLMSMLTRPRLVRVLQQMLDEAEFLSPYGLRSLSAFHLEHPASFQSLSLRYLPGESDTGMFGGNSNWRGPIWFPLNYLLVNALRQFHQEFGDELRVEHPTGSGRQCTLQEVADDLSGRLIGLFLDGPDGRRPVFGTNELFQRDPGWHDLIPFHEYFHGDTGQGLGAPHQTGWTALVGNLVLERGRPSAVADGASRPRRDVATTTT